MEEYKKTVPKSRGRGVEYAQRWSGQDPRGPLRNGVVSPDGPLGGTAGYNLSCNGCYFLIFSHNLIRQENTSRSQRQYFKVKSSLTPSTYIYIHVYYMDSMFG